MHAWGFTISQFHSGNTNLLPHFPLIPSSLTLYLRLTFGGISINNTLKLSVFISRKLKICSLFKRMKQANLLFLGFLLVYCLGSVFVINAEDPYLFFTWTVTYGTRYPLGVPQQVIHCFVFFSLFYFLGFVLIIINCN